MLYYGICVYVCAPSKKQWIAIRCQFKQLWNFHIVLVGAGLQKRVQSILCIRIYMHCEGAINGKHCHPGSCKFRYTILQLQGDPF